MKESDKKKIGEAYLRLHSCNENDGMTHEEAINYFERSYASGNTDDERQHKPLPVHDEHIEDGSQVEE